jgi:hypothetical protein
MKKACLTLALLLVAIGAYAAQKTDYTIRQVRDPVQLRTYLNANAADAQSRIAAVEAAGVGGTLEPALIIVGNASSNAAAVAVSGDVTIATNGAVTIAANAVEESMLKAVDTAADEDFLSYEATTGDFEWHSAAEVGAKLGALGTLTTNVVIGTSNTNTIVLRTVASGLIVVDSWTVEPTL